MPEFILKPAKESAKKDTKREEKERSKVTISSFPVPTINANVVDIDVLNHTVDAHTNISDRRFYCRDFNYFKVKGVYYTKYTHCLIDYIMEHIEFDSNIVKFTIGDAARDLCCNKDTIVEALKQLTYKENGNEPLLDITDIQSTYIINHNRLFKGNMIKFVAMYNKQYKNVKVERNEKGEIKLRKYIIGKFNN